MNLSKAEENLRVAIADLDDNPNDSVIIDNYNQALANYKLITQKQTEK